MIYRVLWKERYKPDSYIATRDGHVVEVSMKRLEFLKGHSVWLALAKVRETGATISCTSPRVKIYP